MQDKKYHYDAFISYRHGDLDDYVATRLHKKLETYRLPKRIAKQVGSRKLTRVFRDREELMSSSSLGDELEGALEQSRYLILVASSRTLDSPWVIKELTTFKAMHGAEHILILMIEGKVEQIIPDFLRVNTRTYEENGQLITVEEKVEPLATDIRADSKKEIGRKLDEEILRLIAPIVGCRYDDLKQRHKERRRKKFIGLALAFILLLGGFGAFNGWRVWQIEEQMRSKLATQSRALADQSLRLLEKGDRMKAILVAKEALPKNFDSPERPLMDEVLYALSQALYVYKYDFRLVPEKTLDYTRPLCYVKASTEGRWVATESEEGYIELWDLETGELQKTIKDKDNRLYIEDIEFIDESSYIIMDATGLRVEKILTNQVDWQIGKESKYKFYLSPDRKQVLVIGEGVSLYDLESKDILAKQEHSELNTYMDMHVAWNTEKNILAIGQEGKIYLWEMVNANWKMIYECPYNMISGLVFTKDNALVIASNDEDKDVMELLYGAGRGNLSCISFEEEGAKELWQLKSEKSRIDLLKVNSEEPWQLVMRMNNVLETVDATTGEVLFSAPQSSTIRNYILIGGSIAICGMEDGSVRTLMLDLKDVFEQSSFNHSSGITDIAFARGGRILLTTGEDKKVYIYKDIEGTPKKTLEGIGNHIRQGIYSEDNKWLCTVASNGHEVYLWDAVKWELVRRISGEYIGEAGFLEGDSQIYILEKEKGLNIYNRDGSLVKSFENDSAIDVYYKSPYLCLVGTDNVQLIEEKKLSVVRSIPIVEGKKSALISEQKLLTLSTAGELTLIDIETSANEIEEGQVLKEKVVDFVVGENFLAVSLEDGSVEMIDLKTYQVVDTTSNDGIAVSSLVVDDNKQVLWIGYEDTTVWQYVLEDKSKMRLKEELPSPMKQIYFYEDDNKLAIITEEDELLVYDSKNQKRLVSLKNILGINGRCDEFITGNNESLYVVPFYTPQMLLEEAERQLGDRTLTKYEKEEYFIQE